MNVKSRGCRFKIQAGELNGRLLLHLNMVLCDHSEQKKMEKDLGLMEEQIHSLSNYAVCTASRNTKLLGFFSFAKSTEARTPLRYHWEGRFTLAWWDVFIFLRRDTAFHIAKIWWGPKVHQYICNFIWSIEAGDAFRGCGCCTDEAEVLYLLLIQQIRPNPIPTSNHCYRMAFLKLYVCWNTSFFWR